MGKNRGVRIWTAAAHNLLYQELVKRFGKLPEWTTNNRPGRGLDLEYDLFCESFAKIIGADSGDAVKQQIAFARQETLPNIRSPVRRYRTLCPIKQQPIMLVLFYLLIFQV